MTSKSDDQTTTAFHDEIRTMLRLADATSLAGSLGRFLMGAGVCLGIGLIFAIFLAVVFDNLWFGWKSWLLAYLLIVVPLLVWYERRSRQSYLSEAVRTAGPAPSNPAVSLVFGMQRLGRRLSGPARPTHVDAGSGPRPRRRPRARSARADGGVPIKELMKPPENMHVFGSAVDLLDRHDCIGKSTDGRSLWLNSTYRRKLNERRTRLQADDG